MQVVQINNSQINLKFRKESVLNPKKIVLSVKKIMPFLQSQFDIAPDKITLIDADGPIGGGPTGPFSVAISSTHQISNEYAEMIEQATGWKKENSTIDYINKHYSDFADPEQAYIDDIVLHELMHTYLGFGLTKASVDPKDWWFTFGLGLLMDRQIWEKLYYKSSPLFDAPVKQWKNIYSKNKMIDQRLINPDTQNDKDQGLIRLQIYGHGKALVYLQNLRKLVGEKRFDKAVKSWVQTRRDLNYDLFVQENFRSFKAEIKKLESQFTVR